MLKLSAYTTAMTLVLGIAGGWPLVAMAQGTADPESVIRGYIDAANAGDAEAALSFWADDATYTVLPAAITGQSTFVGKAQLRPLVEAFAAQHSRSEIQEPLVVEGDRVSGRFRSAVDSFRQLGIDALESTAEAIVRDGKIQSGTYRFTSESVARLQGARAAVAQKPSAQLQTAVPRAGDAGTFPALAIAAVSALVLSGRLAFRRWRQSEIARRLMAHRHGPDVPQVSTALAGHEHGGTVPPHARR